MASRLLGYLGRHHVALLALFIALGGTSYAVASLPANSVGTKQLRKNAVKSTKVKNGSLRLLDFSRTTATKLKGEKGDQGTRGDTGPQGQRGEQGARGDTGPQGDPGPKGETGPQGQPGTARAYARIDPTLNPSIDPNFPNRGIESVVQQGPGRYCVHPEAGIPADLPFVVTAVGDVLSRYEFALAHPVPCTSTPGGQGFHVTTAVLDPDGSFPNITPEKADDVRFNIVVP